MVVVVHDGATVRPRLSGLFYYCVHRSTELGVENVESQQKVYKLLVKEPPF